MEKIFNQILIEICNEENIRYKYLSKDWIIMLEKNGITKFISGYKFDLNSHGIGLIVDDKYALYEVLKQKNIPVIEHKIVYNKTNQLDYAKGCNTYEYVKEYFEKNNKHIVIKPNNGTCGKNVFNITNVNEIDSVLDKIFAKNFSISICPFYTIKNEYRIIMLDGESKLVYKKYRPIVIGDGNKNIRQLLIEFNSQYFKDLKKLENIEYDKVLSNNESYEYNWKFNLSQGAIAKKVLEDNFKDKLTDLAKKVSNEINLRFGSIDIIETTDNELYVLEVNSGVMIENYVKLNLEDYIEVKNIYKEAIVKLFE